MASSINDIYQQKEQIELNEFQPKEAYNRLVISRGYYASFSHTCNFVHDNKKKITLLKKDKNGKFYGSHGCYYESLILCNNTSLIELGQKLKKYHILRKKSDYKLKLNVTDLDVIYANEYLHDCKNIIDNF